MAKVGKFCLAKRVKVEWLFQMGETLLLQKPLEYWFCLNMIRV